MESKADSRRNKQNSDNKGEQEKQAINTNPNICQKSFISDSLVQNLKDLFDNDQKLALSIASKIKAKIKINISKGKDIKHWIIDCTNINEKPVIKLCANDEDKVAVTISCNDETFNSLANGSLSTEYAYMRGLLSIKGSMGLALKVKTLLELMNSSK